METGTLTITRVRYFNDKMSGKGFNIFIDGQDHGKVAYNNPQSFELPIGNHQLYAKINWGLSREITVNIKPHETTEVALSLSNPPTKIRMVVAIIFAIIYFGGLYLGKYLHTELIRDIAFYSLAFYLFASLIIYKKKSPLYSILFGRKDYLYLEEVVKEA